LLSAAAGPGSERTKAGRAGQPTRRSSDCALEGRTLASAQKKAEQEGRLILFVDEAGFYLLPMVVRTYAPVGQTPILHVRLTHDHLFRDWAITAQGHLLFQMQDHSYRGADVVGFLQLVLRKLPGKLLIIWDGSPIHRGQEITAFLAQGAAKRIHLERLPGYAPDLNPQEGIWNLLKRRELKNVCCRDLADLALQIQRAKARLRHRRSAILACFPHAACPL
jgi:transposase